MSIEPDEQEATIPAIFEHACNVYKTMEADAVLYWRDPQDQDKGKLLVWEGHLTKLITGLNLSVPYYTSVTRELKRMGCIRQMRRGGGNATSQWELLREPSEELWRDNSTRTSGISSRKGDKLTMLEARLIQAEKVIAKMSSDYETIIDILMEKEKNNA